MRTVCGYSDFMDPMFFKTSADWRDWLSKNHDKERELLVGFYKKDSGKPSITWPESVDVALCFGWIDGVRRKIDEVSYSIRFTPRKPRSAWSLVNINRVAELIDQGLLHPAGTKAFEARQEVRSGVYAFEQEQISFTPEQPPWYRKTSTWWVISAKREDTKQKRLTTLIQDSEEGRTIAQLTCNPKVSGPRIT